MRVDELVSLEPDPGGAAEGRIRAPADAPDGSLERLVDRYLEAWGVTDPDRRLSLLRSVLAPDATYVDPFVPTALEGADALSLLIAETQGRMPPFRLERVDRVDRHHEHARFSWFLRLASGEIDNAGVDVIELDPAGRIARIVGFFDPPS